VKETLPDPIEQPDPTDPPVDAPVVAPRPSPTPAPDDGVADVAPQPDSVDPNSLDRCGPWPALEAQSLAGRLGPAAVCLEEVLSDIAMTQVNRDKLGRILIVDARTRCTDGAGCGDYERVQRTFFEEVTRSDAEMLYAFSTHLAGIADTDASRREALLWARRAMELKAAWQGPTRIQRVDALNERIARLTYATFSADSSNERARVEARNAAVEWMNYRITIGGDHAPALALCASVEGSEANCKTRGHDVGAQFAVTFLSRPLGATVTVDGQQYGTAPQVVELPAGPHEVRMQTEESSTVQRIDTGLDKPTRWLWSVSDDAWTGTK
jgi:hypothetical protein